MVFKLYFPLKVAAFRAAGIVGRLASAKKNLKNVPAPTRF
jgi:hypothetical protein